MQLFPLDISMGFLSVRIINHNNLECEQCQQMLCNHIHFLTSTFEGDFKIQNKRANDYLSVSAPGKSVLIFFFNIKLIF